MNMFALTNDCNFEVCNLGVDHKQWLFASNLVTTAAVYINTIRLVINRSFKLWNADKQKCWEHFKAHVQLVPLFRLH